MSPHVLESSCLPPVPNPILELQEWQSPPSLARIPILAFECVVMVHSLHWTLPCYRWAERRHQDQLRTSTCHDPVRCCGIVHQRLLNIQGTGALSDFNKIGLLADLHTEADLGEGCVPVGGKFGLLWVKSSLASINIEGVFILPVCRGVVERLLWEEQLKIKAR